MKNLIRRIWMLALGIVVVAAGASGQAKRHQLAPRQNGGMAAWHQLADGQKKLDSKQSQYTWLELDPLGTGTGYCYADPHAINNSEQIVVNWGDPNDPNCGTYHASLWEKGKWKLLDYPVDPNCAEPATYLTSITDWGYAFGGYWSSCPYEAAGGVNVKNKRWSFLPDVPGFPFNQGFSMSDNGLAVGVVANLDTTVFKHWVWDGRKYIFLTFPANWDVNTWWAGPLFINNRGQIAGEYFDTTDGHERGYLQEGAKITTLDVPGNPDNGTFANGMTNNGYALVCASYGIGSAYYPSASFVYRQGKYTQLPTPPFNDVTLWFAFGINDRGDIVGRWWDSNNNEHAYVAFKH